MSKEHDSPEASDNITIQVYDSESAPTLEATQTAQPKQTHRTHNATRAAYHKTVIQALAGSVPDLKLDAIALGDSTTSTADLAETSALGNELFRTGVVDVTPEGQTARISAFIDASEANGLNLEEAALVAETNTGDLPVNRFLIDDPGDLLSPKSRSETVRFTIEITQQDS